MTWLYIGAAVVIVVAGVGEAQQQREAGRANREIEENNARLAQAQADDAAALGARESEQSAWRTRALIGRQRAAIASANLDSELGTPFDLQTDAALFGGADKSAIQLDAARKAWGFGAEALNARNRGNIANWQGQSQSKLTILSSIGSAMGTAAGGFGKKGGGNPSTGGGYNVSGSDYSTSGGGFGSAWAYT